MDENEWGSLRSHVIAHAMPKNLLVDEVVRKGQGTLSAVSDTNIATKREVDGGAHG